MSVVKGFAWGVLLMLFTARSAYATIGCLNADGEPVDWCDIVARDLSWATCMHLVGT